MISWSVSCLKFEGELRSGCGIVDKDSSYPEEYLPELKVRQNPDPWSVDLTEIQQRGGVGG